MGYQSGRGGQRPGAGRPSRWKNPVTCPIRVPIELADQVLEYAQKLDKGITMDTAQNQNFDQICQELLNDDKVTRNGKDKGAVKRVLERLKQLL